MREPFIRLRVEYAVLPFVHKHWQMVLVVVAVHRNLAVVHTAADQAADQVADQVADQAADQAADQVADHRLVMMFVHNYQVVKMGPHTRLAVVAEVGLQMTLQLEVEPRQHMTVHSVDNLGYMQVVAVEEGVD